MAKNGTVSAFTWRFSYGNDSHIGSLTFTQDQSLTSLIAVCCVYLLVVQLAKRTSFFASLQKLKYMHNVALCLYSGVTALFVSYVLVQEGHFQTAKAAVCQPVSDPRFQYFSFAFLLSKIWEWVDTILLVKKGKELRFLHQFHHMTTFWLYAVNNTFLSSAKYGVGLNALVHFVMYAHYAKPFPPAFRKMITQFQIVQFLCAIVIHSMIFIYDCDPHLHTHFWEFLTPYSLVIPYLVLFLNFYLQQYLKSSKTKTA